LARAAYTAKQFIEVIPGSGGIISTIARRVGCDWHTAKSYIEKHATVKAAYEAECEAVLDMAESKIIGAMNDDDIPTAKWYLTMKGRQRGYAPTERVEHSGEIAVKGYVTISPDDWDEDND